jgi:hypothetical protein
VFALNIVSRGLKKYNTNFAEGVEFSELLVNDSTLLLLFCSAREMAFFERVNGENFSIFQGNDVENGENARLGKDSQLSSRAPLQDRTLMVTQNNSKMLPQWTGKQQVCSS